MIIIIIIYYYVIKGLSYTFSHTGILIQSTGIKLSPTVIVKPTPSNKRVAEPVGQIPVSSNNDGDFILKCLWIITKYNNNDAFNFITYKFCDIFCCSEVCFKRIAYLAVLPVSHTYSFSYNSNSLPVT